MRSISCHSYNSLHKLTLTSDGYHCCELPAVQRQGEGPMRKEGSGMVAFGDCLGVFGGFGEPHGPTQPGSFIKYYGSVGWTNEFHVYHLKEGKVNLVCRTSLFPDYRYYMHILTCTHANTYCRPFSISHTCSPYTTIQLHY